ncbi:MAG: methyltransferase domain-containing protein [Chloroflexi bacterium]|jgi:ubiquinone/menaquinone biosynthesis C-methylase UbiE|nr:methyltransferase domain-containing protein [Chloroflexota bacterium]MBT4073355.1 methyltransferase domain-containing protein [Chloroflexota bacterium]MBT6682618.1 methyltransferase domain-containing protein [Chloroflexota bacterium]
MSTESPTTPDWDGRPFYGYDSNDVQATYSGRQAESVADFLLPHLTPGMSLLDVGCGPGSITLGLGAVVSPGNAVGVDLEPGMIEQAKAMASEAEINNVEFQVANIYDLPFDDGQFDVVFTSAILEHLADPVGALRSLKRVLKPGGIAAMIQTDWGDPFIVPESKALSRFLELFEAGFNRNGGSLNRGRYLRANMQEAGFEIEEFAAQLANYTDSDRVTGVVNGYIAWMENLPLFRESIELGLTTEAELVTLKAEMQAWSAGPDAYFANARTYAIARK